MLNMSNTIHKDIKHVRQAHTIQKKTLEGSSRFFDDFVSSNDTGVNGVYT